MTITITDSQVEAVGADGTQGIGARSGSDSGSVTIDCGQKRVIATGGKNAPGIGGGRITINSGDIRARGGRNAAGIGGGSGGSPASSPSTAARSRPGAKAPPVRE
ncbi:MAG: hypothetical protein IJ087_09220 [Eggerthellaceae bacterium]|nr:hypothetical protein [Eggerthellaceae bacterium]